MKLACVLALIFVPLFGTLDLILFPERARFFIGLRFLNLIENVAILILFIKSRSLKPLSINIVATIFFCSIGLMIAYMCRFIGGYDSTYYAGINLLILAMSLIMPWETRYTAISGSIMYVGYLMLAYVPGFHWKDAINNNYFLVSTVAVTTIATHFMNKLRLREFTARQSLKELDKAKTRFFSNVTHEFRTPLVALSSTIQMIMDQGLQDPETQRRLLSSSKDSLEGMLENVNDLLMKARSEKGLVEMKWSEIDIGEFIARALQVFETIAEKRKTKLIFSNKLARPLQIYVDRQKLKKILNNLVGNALKFTENGTVEVILDRTETHCALQVKDTGKGIPKEDLATIFDPFTQASNNLMRDVQGTGLGLSMVKDFIGLHKGEVGVESEVGKGSLFTVTFPLGDAHVDKDKIDMSQLVEEGDAGASINIGIKSFEDLDLEPFKQRDPGKQNILLVEDNPQVIQVLAYVLQDHYNVHFAKDGQEGLEKAGELKPDLIISDIMMPRMDGYELVRRIKGRPDLKMIPVILLTSKADKESKIKGFEEGADEYLSKPFNNREVLTRVKGLLDKAKMEMEFIHAEKMISLGQLVAGIAHEINNPISFAKNAAGGLDDIVAAVEKGTISLKEGVEMMRGSLDAIKEGTYRVCAITEALRGFVREGAKGFLSRNIHSGIDSTLTIIHANHSAEIQFHKRYELKDEVVCNVNQLNQVFMNLLQNAVHALGGKENGEVWIHTYGKDGFAYVIIRDNGPGIPKHIQRKIFTPFFTTKGLGQGMGFGLYISQQIVQEHGGSLNMESEEGKGTEFTIQLPFQGPGGQNEEAGFTNLSIDQGMDEIQYPHRR